MDRNVAPTFHKVEILVKNMVNNIELPSINKVEYSNAAMMISGNFMIITTLEVDGSQISKIYHLSEIHAYKTYNN